MKKENKNKRFIYGSDLGLTVVKSESKKDDIQKAGQDQIKGGKADNMTIEDIAKKHKTPLHKILKEFSDGIKIEMEHTNNESKAEEIAMDHLFEIPDYYTRLKKMEIEVKEEMKKNEQQ